VRPLGAAERLIAAGTEGELVASLQGDAAAPLIRRVSTLTICMFAEQKPVAPAL